MVPIAALLIGYDETMKVVLLDTARSLRLGWFARTRKATLPALMPAILLGVRVAAPVSLVITLLGEILTRVGGLGALIALSQRNYLAAQVYGLMSPASSASS